MAAPIAVFHGIWLFVILYMLFMWISTVLINSKRETPQSVATFTAILAFLITGYVSVFWIL